MSEIKKPPATTGGVVNNSFPLSRKSGIARCLYFSRKIATCKPHSWVSGNRHPKPWGGFVFNPHGPELDGAGGIVGKPDKRHESLFGFPIILHVSAGLFKPPRGRRIHIPGCILQLPRKRTKTH